MVDDDDAAIVCHARNCKKKSWQADDVSFTET